jgi:hypothetical protein
MYLTASIPPQVGFYIARMGDAETEPRALPAPAVAKKAASAKKTPAVKKAGATAKR